MVRAAITILGKDLRLRMRDRSVFLFAIVVPLGLTVLFSFVFPDTEELSLTAAVVDEDGGALAAGFVEDVLPALVEDGLVTLVDVDDEAGVRAGLRDGTLDAAWIMPAGFSDAVTSGRAADIEVLANPDRPLLAEVARGVAGTYASRIDTLSLAVATTAAGSDGRLSEAQLEEVVSEVDTAQPPITVASLLAEDHQLDATSYLAAGMAAFFVFFTVQYGITGLLEERQQGTIARLLAAPISPGAIHLGKALGAFVLGIVSMTVLAVASNLLLGADWGPPAGVAVMVLAVVLAAMGLMALVGTFARTAEQASNYQSIVAVVLGMLGGVFFPVTFGGPLQVLMLVSPHRWFLRGIGDLAGGAPVTTVLSSAGAILVFAAITAALAVVRLRRTVSW